MLMYNLPTDGCNLEIMGYPFYAENVSPNESFRRREYNFNPLVGGTQIVTPGAYVGLDFSITTHVRIDPDRPDEHNAIFQEMMSKPVEVTSPEIGGTFKAIVVIKPQRDKLTHLKLDISIKEVPDKESKIPGESFTVPASRDVKPEKNKDNAKSSSENSSSKNNSKLNSITDPALKSKAQSFINQFKSKKKTVQKKTKSNTKGK